MNTEQSKQTDSPPSHQLFPPSPSECLHEYNKSLRSLLRDIADLFSNTLTSELSALYTPDAALTAGEDLEKLVSNALDGSLEKWQSYVGTVLMCDGGDSRNGARERVVAKAAALEPLMQPTKCNDDQDREEDVFGQLAQRRGRLMGLLSKEKSLGNEIERLRKVIADDEAREKKWEVNVSLGGQHVEEMKRSLENVETEMNEIEAVEQTCRENYLTENESDGLLRAAALATEIGDKYRHNTGTIDERSKLQGKDTRSTWSLRSWGKSHIRPLLSHETSPAALRRVQQSLIKGK